MSQLHKEVVCISCFPEHVNNLRRGFTVLRKYGKLRIIVWDDVKTLRHEQRPPKPFQSGSTPPSHAKVLLGVGSG
jgi:hypothetical protein